MAQTETVFECRSGTKTRWYELLDIALFGFKLVVSVRWGRYLAFLVEKHFLDMLAEKTRDLDSQRKAWVIPARFNRVDGLTGYADCRGQLGLRPFPLSAQNAEARLHGCRQE
jgi:hypothetical protein